MKTVLKDVNGKIRPEGWMLEYLRRDRDGITGHLGKLCRDVSSDVFTDKKVGDEINGCWSSWWPGESEGNWRDGFTRLAYVLEDPELIREITAYVEKLLEFQEEDGYMGCFTPGERFSNGARSGELWTQSRLMLVLLSYYSNTGDQRVVDALERLCDLIVRQYGPDRSLYEIPDEDGSKTHSLMIIEEILMVYSYIPKPEYLEFCEFLYRDYSRYAPDAIFPCYDLSSWKATDPLEPFVGHGPHTCEALRIPILLYAATGNTNYYAIFKAAFGKLKKYLCLSGSCKSDELIGVHMGNIVPAEGKLVLGECYPIPSLGFEYCSTTELMFSFTAAARITGDLSYADYEEWMIMNAAMAAKRADGKAIQYLCSDNLYQATKSVGDRWDYSPTHTDAAVCCAPNSCKIMPYHVTQMWQTDGEALYAMYYGPSTLETTVDGSPVTVKQTTCYPFEKRTSFTIGSTKPFQQKFVFRFPAWAKDYRVTLNGTEAASEKVSMGSGRAVVLEGSFRDGDVLTLEFICDIRTVTAVDGTRAVADGPLLYSLWIPEKREDYHHYEEEPFCDTNFTPAEEAKWNYTLVLDSSRAHEVLRRKSCPSEGYVWEEPPVKIDAMMISDWAVPEWVELAPIGCTTLRRTTFPAVDRVGTAHNDAVNEQ